MDHKYQQFFESYNFVKENCRSKFRIIRRYKLNIGEYKGGGCKECL